MPRVGGRLASKTESHREVPCIFCNNPVVPKEAVISTNRTVPGGKIGLAHPPCKELHYK